MEKLPKRIEATSSIPSGSKAPSHDVAGCSPVEATPNPKNPSLKSFNPYVFYYRPMTTNEGQGHALFWTYARFKDYAFPSTLPPYDIESMPEDYRPADVSQLLWAKNAQPHLPLMPTGDCFTGPIFQRLCVTHASVPIIPHQGRYQLEPNLAYSWRRLENALINVSKRLLTGLLFMLNSWQQWPSSYGYLRTHSTEKQARRCVMTSRDGFRELIASVEYGVAFRGENWQQYIMERDPRFDGGWLDMLGDAIRRNTHIGAIMDMTDTYAMRHVSRLQQVCPLWFLGALISPSGKITFRELESPHIHIDRPSKEEMLAFYREMRAFEQWVPTQDLEPEENGLWVEPVVQLCPNIDVPGVPLRVLPTSYPLSIRSRQDDSLRLVLFSDPTDLEIDDVSLTHHPRFMSVSPLPLESFSPIPPISPFLPPRPDTLPPILPDPLPGTDQQKGETWQEFFERRKLADERILQRETIWERQSRMSRTQHYSTGAIPNEKATVYLWRDISGFLLRERVARGNVKTIWEDFTSSQRRYNTVRNEFDLCKAFPSQPLFDPSPPTSPTRSEIEDDDELMPDTEPFQESPYSMELPNDEFTQDLMVKDLVDIYAPAIVVDDGALLDLLEDCYSRYGFVQYQGSLPKSRSQFTAIEKAKTALSHRSNTSNLTPPIQDSVMTFSSFLANYHRDLVTPPATLWDLHRSCPQYLDLDRSNLVYQFVDFTLTNPNQTREHKALYLINPRTPSNHKRNDILIAVQDPATALQSLRNSWGPTTEDIIHNFVNQGFPFILLWRKNCFSKPLFYSRPLGLGYRPPGFTPTIADYGIYEQHCHSALTPQVISAAIKRGGIIWRLVQEHIQSNSEVVDILQRFQKSLSKRRFFEQSLDP